MSFARKVARRALRKERKQPGVGGFRVKCREHGGKPWRGDLVCEKCGRVHLIDGEMDHPTIGKDGVCPCGAMMFPSRDEKGEPVPEAPFFGRIACHDCAQREHAKQKQRSESDAAEYTVVPPKVDG